MENAVYTICCDFCDSPVQVVYVDDDGALSGYSRDHIVMEGQRICLDCAPIAGYKVEHRVIDALYTCPISDN